jgi:hypothetical protein
MKKDEFLHEMKRVAIIHAQLINYLDKRDGDIHMFEQLVRYNIGKVDLLLDTAAKHMPEEREMFYEETI